MHLGSRLDLIGRERPLFQSDMDQSRGEIDAEVSNGRFLVVGGAGSIGSAVVKELFARNPRVLHVIDSSENNLAELVRDIRSSLGYIQGDFHAYCFDALGREFEAFERQSLGGSQGYDYVLNFAALKHVRSEKDPFTLMRLIDVNIFLTKKLLHFANACCAKKFFCVSTDKAANPVNMMGGSKRIMEMFLGSEHGSTKVSSARFANVAFSDGSLPHAWTERVLKQQPISAPIDVKRYFMTDRESAHLCLLSIVGGNDSEIYFPKLDPDLHLNTFSSVAERYLRDLGWEPYPCESEAEARQRIKELNAVGKWPCYFFGTDTTGEKDFEEFFVQSEEVNWNRYADIGVVKNTASCSSEDLFAFTDAIAKMRDRMSWTRDEVKSAFELLLPNFHHLDTGKFLDGRM